MFCAVLVTEQSQGLILMLLGIVLNTQHAFSFPVCFTSTGKTAQNLLVQRKVRKRLKTRSSKQISKDWSVTTLGTVCNELGEVFNWFTQQGRTV